MTVTPERLSVRCYWRLEDTPELHLAKREDYVAAFRDVFDESVRCRVSGENATIGSTLSGGLDSGSVTATAARLLREEDRPALRAFTSVPLMPTGSYVGSRFGDEYPFAAATADFSGHVELQTIDAAGRSPVLALRQLLDIHDEPAHAAGNAFWILELLEAARSHGCTALLTGQMGNAGVSWTGDVFSQSLPSS